MGGLQEKERRVHGSGGTAVHALAGGGNQSFLTGGSGLAGGSLPERCNRNIATYVVIPSLDYFLGILDLPTNDRRVTPESLTARGKSPILSHRKY